MARRLTTALLLIGVLLSGFIWQGLAWLTIGFSGLIAVLCTWEVADLARKRDLRVYRRVAAWGVLALMLEATMTGMQYSVIIFGLAVCFALVVRMPGKVQGAWADIAATCFAMAYIGIPMAALTALFVAGPEARVWMLLTLGVIWSSDTMALFVGKRFGKTKFWPKLSPGKTWEGCLGGLMGAVIVAAFFRFFAPGTFANISHLELLLFALLFSVISIFGDLAESLLKRDVGVKDSGSELTGHGGFLDLMDAVLFCAIPLMAYLHLFHPGVLAAF